MVAMFIECTALELASSHIRVNGASFDITDYIMLSKRIQEEINSKNKILNNT